MVKLSDGLLGWVSEVVDGRLADVEPLYLETGRDSGSFTDSAPLSGGLSS
jgi:hypothetical protein